MQQVRSTQDTCDTAPDRGKGPTVRDGESVPVLTMQAFGFPVLCLGDEHLVFVRRKTSALLLYLAIIRRVQSRDTLANLLWGEMSQERAMANLRKSLSELREQVSATVVIGFHTVAINPDYPLELDVAAFEAAVARGIATEDVPLLMQAVARYPADFLAGFNVPIAEEFDAWASLYREHLREQLIAALETLATLHSARGEYRAALGPARRVVALDPWREEGQRQLMQVMVATGDRAAAVAQYAVCRQTLAEELGIEPGAETVALYEQLRAGTDAADMSDGSPAAMTGHERKDESVHPPAHARPPACRRGRSLLRASAHPGMVAGRERPGSRGHRAPCHGHASSEDGSAPAISILLAQSQDA